MANEDKLMGRLVAFLSAAVLLYGIVDVREWKWIVFPLLLMLLGIYIGWLAE